MALVLGVVVLARILANHLFFFSSRRRHTRFSRDWSSDVCSSDLYFAAEHGPSVCGFAFRVKNAQKAYARALELGAQPMELHTGFMELRLPAIKGIGGAPLYLIDRDRKSVV